MAKKNGSKRGRGWVSVAFVALMHLGHPLEGGDVKFNFSGAHFVNVNVTQVTNVTKFYYSEPLALKTSETSSSSSKEVGLRR